MAQADLVRPEGLEAELLHSSGLILCVYGFILLGGLGVDLLFARRLRRAPLAWDEALSRFYWRPWDLADGRFLLLVLAGGFLFSLAARSGVIRLAAAVGLSASTCLVIVQSLFFHWAGLLAVAGLLVRRRLPWRSAFGRPGARLPGDFGRGLLILLGAMPVLMAAALGANLVLQLFGLETSLQDVAFVISDETSPWLRAYFFLLAVGLAPAFEELLFRGILLPALAKKFGATASLVAVSLLFAGIHGHLPSLAPLFVLSLALGLAYIGTGSLAVSMFMHALFNGITVTLLYIIR